MDRRHFLVSSAALAAGACASPPLTSPFSSGSGIPRTAAPDGACDCHIHILDPRFPATGGWRGPPVDIATIDRYFTFQSRVGTERAVVVTPSTYGTDNRATIEAVRRLGGKGRGIAVIDCYAPPSDLAELPRLGIRGLRINFVSPQPWGRTDLGRLQATARIADDLGLHLQIYAGAPGLAELSDEIGKLTVPVVIDHLGSPDVTLGPRGPGHQAALRLLANGRTWIKLSGAYISSRSGPPRYADLSDLARSFIAAAPERLVWGSDWPHRGQSGRWPDDAVLFDLLSEWADDEMTRHRILVSNPAELYGFRSFAPPKGQSA